MNIFRAVGNLVKRATGIAGTSTIFFGEGWFQQGYNFPGSRDSMLAFSAVYSSINVLSQDVSKCPMKVYRVEGKKRTQVLNLPLCQVIFKPNHYQTWMQFMTQVMLSLLYRGNAYIYVDRNGRNDPTDMYPLMPDKVQPWVAADGSVFYGVGRDPMKPDLLKALVPQRDMIHIRLETLTHPLIGITPLYAAGYSASAGLSMQKQAANFFQRAARPSGVLKSPKTLKQGVIDRLRGQWEEYYGGENTGRVAILEDGLDWTPLTMSAVDAQLVDQLKWSVADVARAFRVPLFLLGQMESITYNNASTLQSVYLSGPLSYYLRLIEEAFATYFDLPDQKLEVKFDVSVLLRMEMNLRMDALAKGIQGGIYTPNEAREFEGLNPVDGGDQLLLQGQMTPISQLGAAPPKPAAELPAPPAKAVDDAVVLQELIARNLRELLPARV